MRDSVIATAQAEVEHLEMAYYRNMVAGASLIGQAEAAHLLRKTSTKGRDGPDDRAKRPAAAAEGRADSVGPERAEGGNSPPALISWEG